MAAWHRVFPILVILRVEMAETLNETASGRRRNGRGGVEQQVNARADADPEGGGAHRATQIRPPSMRISYS